MNKGYAFLILFVITLLFFTWHTFAAGGNETVTIDSPVPVNGFNTSDATPEISFHVNHSNHTANNFVLIYVDGVKNGQKNVTNNTVEFYNITTQINGTHAIIVEFWNQTCATKCGSAFNSTEKNITIDYAAPVINLISPDNGNTTVNPQSPNIAFVFNVTDALKTNCTLLINGVLWNTNTSVNITGGQTVFTNTSYRVNNTWGVNCTDTAGNNGNSTLWTYMLSSVQFNGTVKDENGNALNNSIINISVISMSDWSTITNYNTTTNESGWFSLYVWSQSALGHQPSIIHYNESVADFKSKSLPTLPASPEGSEIQMISGTTFYLAPAGTINITAINSTGHRVPFQYQIKDTALGYPIAEDHTSFVSEIIVQVPKNRNYSIMIYPNQSMPVSFNWNNFSANESYTFNGGISSYNATTRTLAKRFNLTMTIASVEGYINVTGVNGYSNLTIIPYLLESGNMVHTDYGDMPYNLSSSIGASDIYNLSTGYFNISLPATVETTNILLFATAIKNNVTYYGGFRNITLEYPTTLAYLNFTTSHMKGLLGTAANVTMDRMDGVAQRIAIPVAKQRFNLINTSGYAIGNASVHLEVTVDYSSFGALEFTWMGDVQQSQPFSNFDVILLNSTGVKEMNLFISGGGGSGGGDSGAYSPRHVSTMSAAQITTNNNITVRKFNPQDIDGTLASGQIYIEMFLSNSTCDVPAPPSGCSLGGSKNMNSSDPNNAFSPMKAVFGGGKISFRMGKNSTGILIHYVNVDMLASGPPDGLFENDAGTTESSNSFSNAAKFGSQGPTIYDYVLISMPYVEGSSSQTGLSENNDVNISIPTFYDDNWVAVWSSTNGTNASHLAANYTHYSSKQSEWQVLMSPTNCTRTVSELNATKPCYIDTTNNRIWVRLPHFSGTGPTVQGGIIIASTTPATATSGGGGGGYVTGEESKSMTFIDLTAGMFNTMSIDTDKISFSEIKFSVKNNVQNDVKIKVSGLGSKPADVNDLNNVYQWLEITHTNLENNNIASAKIKFSVKKSWLSSLGISQGDVILQRFDNGWHELQTNRIGEDADVVKYEASTPGFSIFAITPKSAPPVQTPVEQEPSETPVPSPTPTTGQTTSQPTGQFESPFKTDATAISIIIVVIVIIIFLGYLNYHRHPARRR